MQNTFPSQVSEPAVGPHPQRNPLDLSSLLSRYSKGAPLTLVFSVYFCCLLLLCHPKAVVDVVGQTTAAVTPSPICSSMQRAVVTASQLPAGGRGDTVVCANVEELIIDTSITVLGSLIITDSPNLTNVSIPAQTNILRLLISNVRFRRRGASGGDQTASGGSSSSSKASSYFSQPVQYRLDALLLDLVDRSSTPTTPVITLTVGQSVFTDVSVTNSRIEDGVAVVFPRGAQLSFVSVTFVTIHLGSRLVFTECSIVQDQQGVTRHIVTGKQIGRAHV